MVEEDALEALDALASMASDERLDDHTYMQKRFPLDNYSDLDDDGRNSRQRKAAQRQEKIAPQKWVQCAKCELWRKVPFTLQDEDISDEWECSQNVWDQDHNSCSIPQALTDKEIDEILATQAQYEQIGLNLQSVPLREALDDETEYAREEALGNGFDDDRGYRLKGRKGSSPAQDLEKLGSGRGKGSKRALNPDTKPVQSSRGERYTAANGTRGVARPVSSVRRGVTAGRNRVQAPSGRGKGRVGRGLNEAAEALLGMLGEADEEMPQDLIADEEMEAEVAVPAPAPVLAPVPAGPSYPAGTFRPGRVVWAKVEGHEWWPAKVVRRRAVPRDVAEPPGGKMLVKLFIPVIFFTAQGIPGELKSCEDRLGAALAASAHSGDMEEEEYAWLPAESLKPFKPGEAQGPASTDATLQACVDAATKAVMERQEAEAASEGALDINGHQTDSDGGWGASPVQEVQPPSRPKGGRGRGRGGRGRGRGGRGRRGGRNYRRGRSQALDDDLEDSDSEGGAYVEPEVPAVTPSRDDAATVEQIYGWRWSLPNEPPISPLDYEEALARSADDSTGQQPNSTGELNNVGVNPPLNAMDGDAKDEADAVDALLSAADRADGVPEKEAKYLVKFVGQPHTANKWVSESKLMLMAKRKLVYFKRRHETPCNFLDPAWTIPERLVARRCAPSEPGWQVLVKWTNQGYENCTWVGEAEPVLSKPQYKVLLRQLWQRQLDAEEKALPESAAEEKAAFRAARKNLKDLTEQPMWVRGTQLHPHQLQALNWLRRHTVDGVAAVLADDPGLGKTATAVAFTQALRHEFRSSSPALIIVPPTALSFWEGEFAFWAGQECNVVTFAGSPAARNLIHDHELWLAPGSLDHRNFSAGLNNQTHKVFKADVVLASYEAVCSDANLQAISWNLVIVDERKRMRSALSKVYVSLADFEVKHRLLISSSHSSQASPASLLQSLAFIEPSLQHSKQLPVPNYDELSEASQVQALRELLTEHTLRRSRAETGQAVNAKMEIQIPVSLTDFQADCYRKVLGRFYEALVDPKMHRLSSSRASQAKTICDELRKVVSHPYQINGLIPEDASAEQRADASGKIKVLEQMLHKLKTAEQRALLLSQDPAALNILEEQLVDTFGREAVVRIDHRTPSKERHAAMSHFQSDARHAFIFMQTVSCCGLGTSLPGIACVVIHDSDWNPQADLQAISRCHQLGGSPQGCPIFRLVTKGSVEEKLVQMSGSVQGMEAVYAAGVGNTRSLGSCATLMEDILRWGTQDLFQARKDSEDSLAAEQSGELDGSGLAPVEGGVASTRDSTGNGEAFKQAKDDVAYREDDIGTLLEKTANFGFQEPTGEGEQESLKSGSTFGPGLEGVVVRVWDQDKALEVPAEDEGEDDAEDKDDDMEDDEADDGDAGPVEGASYWASLLSDFAGHLKEEEQDELNKGLRKRSRTEKAAAALAAGPDSSLGLASDAEDGEDGVLDGYDGRKVSSGLMSPMDGGDEQGHRYRSGRSNRGRGGARGRGSRRRKIDEDDDVSEIFEDLKGPHKRRKRGITYEGMRGISEDLENSQEEWSRHEAVMLNISNPKTPEGAIASRAYNRLNELVSELDLDSSVMEMAHQAAKILMLQREEKDAPSDFQDYTLLALVAVSAFLSNVNLGERNGVVLLAQRYEQDVEPLQQVFDFIMDSLDKYRTLYRKMVQLARDGVIAAHPPMSNQHYPRQDQDGLGKNQNHTDMDNFAATLSQIVHADVTQQALQSPLELGQFQIPYPPSNLEAGSATAHEFEAVANNLRELTTRIALRDKIHSIKVKGIQDEYQSFMEKVRGKAQHAIDLANQNFESDRAELTSQVDVLVHVMHSRYYYQNSAAAAAHAAASQIDGESQGNAHPALERNQDSTVRREDPPRSLATPALQMDSHHPTTQQSGNWQSAYRPSEAQLEQLSRAVEANEAAGVIGAGGVGAQAMAPPSLPVQFSHQFQMLGNAAQQGKGQQGNQNPHALSLTNSQALHLNRRSPSLVTKPPLAPPAQQPLPNHQRSNLMKPSFQGAMELAAQANKPSINGGLASMPAVQSGFAMGANSSQQAAALHHQQQIAMAARHLSQGGSVFPLKTLTQEQMAQVQQQIQTSNHFPNNLQGWEQELRHQANLHAFPGFSFPDQQAHLSVLQQMQGQHSSGPFAGSGQARGMTVQSGGSAGHRFLHPWMLPSKSEVASGGLPFFARRTAETDRHAKAYEPASAVRPQPEERATPASSRDTPTPSRSPSPPAQQPGQQDSGFHDGWLQYGQSQGSQSQAPGAPSSKGLDLDPQHALSGKPISQAQQAKLAQEMPSRFGVVPPEIANSRLWPSLASTTPKVEVLDGSTHSKEGRNWKQANQVGAEPGQAKQREMENTPASSSAPSSQVSQTAKALPPAATQADQKTASIDERPRPVPEIKAVNEPQAEPTGQMMENKAQPLPSEPPSSSGLSAPIGLPFPPASWGAQPHLMQHQQASLAPDGMSILPTHPIHPDRPIQPPVLPPRPPAGNQNALSGVLSALSGNVNGHSTSGTVRPDGQLWNPMSTPTSQASPSEIAQGISFTKLLEDHLQS